MGRVRTTLDLLLDILFIGMVLVLATTGVGAQNHGYVLNKGIPGNNSADLLLRVSDDVIAHKPDLVLVLVGTNDLLNTRKMISMSDYYRNIDWLSDSLRLHEIKVVLVSPPTVDTVYLFERHDAALYRKPPIQLLASCRDTLRAFCNRKDMLFIDLFAHFQKMGIPQHEEDCTIRNRTNSESNDGVHLTAKGNRLIAELIYSHLTKVIGEMGRLKIICFGDSITFGVYMEGEGTTNGDTYPAVLKQLINCER